MTSRLLPISCIVMCIAILMTSSVRAIHKRNKIYEVLTFNAALVDITDTHDPDVTDTRMARRDALLNALTDSPADIVCLQEIYFGSDVQAIVNGLSEKYPHSLSQLHINGSLPQQTDVTHEPMCSSNLTILGDCLLTENCLTKTDFGAAVRCAGTRCLFPFITDVLMSGGQNCLSCVTLNLPDFAKITARCTNIDGNANNVNMNNPGVLLLSKTPLEGARVVKYYGDVITVSDRTYLQAKVDKQLTVVCTHLSSTSIPFAEPFISAKLTSYEEANLIESKILTQNFQNDPTAVLLGDFNNALNFTSGLDICVPAAYTLLTSTFNTEPLRVCSICNTEAGLNTFRRFATGNGAIDHVFGGKYVTICKPKRVLTKPFSFMGLPISLSDHFGPKTKVTISCKSRGGKNGK